MVWIIHVMSCKSSTFKFIWIENIINSIRRHFTNIGGSYPISRSYKSIIQQTIKLAVTIRNGCIIKVAAQNNWIGRFFNFCGSKFARFFEWMPMRPQKLNKVTGANIGHEIFSFSLCWVCMLLCTCTIPFILSLLKLWILARCLHSVTPLFILSLLNRKFLSCFCFLPFAGSNLLEQVIKKEHCDCNVEVQWFSNFVFQKMKIYHKEKGIVVCWKFHNMQMLRWDSQFQQMNTEWKKYYTQCWHLRLCLKTNLNIWILTDSRFLEEIRKCDSKIWKISKNTKYFDWIENAPAWQTQNKNFWLVKNSMKEPELMNHHVCRKRGHNITEQAKNPSGIGQSCVCPMKITFKPRWVLNHENNTNIFLSKKN